MMSVLSREELEARIKSFDYWHYPMDFGEGLVVNENSRSKLDLRAFVWPAVLDLCGGSLQGMRVLDVGCNAGFWSFEAHKSGAEYVLGIDARPVHMQQAALVRDALEISADRVEFRQMDLYDLSPDVIGQYDVCLMLRILQHLSHPVLALEKLRSVCRNYLVIDVKLYTKTESPVLYLHVEDPSGVLNGVDGLALRPTKAALEMMLTATGFGDIRGLPPVTSLGSAYHKGERAVYTARVVGSAPQP